ncbi:MAG: DegV family protein [Clostridiales bacterium]|nr:DegV family protein [Candidatus Cacconaster stercorequi]
MRDYVIMTDSCCDLTDHMANELQLEVLPLTLHMEGRDYPNDLAGSALSHEEFYRCIRQGKLATTSGVNVGQYQEAMRRVLEQGKDIVCICFSSALSTTYQSANIAANDLIPEYPDSRIYVIDSLCASLGQGLLLYLAGEQKKKGLTVDQLAEWVEKTKGHICHWFTVDDLNYLKMGGRVSSATALLGTMLSIKPVMHMSDKGMLTVVGKVRGRKASLRAMVDAVEQLGIDPENQTMFICHGDCEDDARAMAEQLKERFGVQTVYINYIGPIIGSHTGPNTMGLFFVGTER